MKQSQTCLDLLDFILKAKLAGYATGGEGNELAFTDGFKGFEFCSSGYRYVDKYYGFNPFSGTESVFGESGALIWVMNYFGGVNACSNEPNRIYDTLKLAMQAIDRTHPFRGPEMFENRGLVYRNEQFGNLDVFQGVETISSGATELYSLYYHGGSLAT